MGQSNRVFSLIALAALGLSNIAQAAAPVATATVVTTAVQVPQEATAPAATPTPAPQAQAAPAVPVVNVVPVKTVYVAENQPVQILDSQGRLLQIIYLKRK